MMQEFLQETYNRLVWCEKEKLKATTTYPITNLTTIIGYRYSLCYHAHKAIQSLKKEWTTWFIDESWWKSVKISIWSSNWNVCLLISLWYVWISCQRNMWTWAMQTRGPFSVFDAVPAFSCCYDCCFLSCCWVCCFFLYMYSTSDLIRSARVSYCTK